MGFTFQFPLPFFVTFESASCVYGLSFAAEDEAKNFTSNLEICVNDLKTDLPSYSSNEFNEKVTKEVEYSRISTNRPIQTSKVNIPSENISCEKSSRKLKKFRLFKRKSKAKPSTTLVIGHPENFTHHGHIGWNLTNGFDIHNIPPEWKKLFQGMGVKRSDLAIPKAREVINSVITPPLPPSRNYENSMNPDIQPKDVVESGMNELNTIN